MRRRGMDHGCRRWKSRFGHLVGFVRRAPLFRFRFVQLGAVGAGNTRQTAKMGDASCRPVHGLVGAYLERCLRRNADWSSWVCTPSTSKDRHMGVEFAFWSRRSLKLSGFRHELTADFIESFVFCRLNVVSLDFDFDCLRPLCHNFVPMLATIVRNIA